jgi:hypothetical protein
MVDSWMAPAGRLSGQRRPESDDLVAGRRGGDPARSDGYLLLDKSKFHASFAADVDPETAAFMADS